MSEECRRESTHDDLRQGTGEGTLRSRNRPYMLKDNSPLLGRGRSSEVNM